LTIDHSGHTEEKGAQGADLGAEGVSGGWTAEKKVQKRPKNQQNVWPLKIFPPVHAACL
jgi:hypothetical protein